MTCSKCSILLFDMKGIQLSSAWIIRRLDKCFQRGAIGAHSLIPSLIPHNTRWHIPFYSINCLNSSAIQKLLQIQCLTQDIIPSLLFKNSKQHLYIHTNMHLDFVPLCTIQPDFLMVFHQKSPHITAQSLSMYIDLSN